MNDAAFVGAFTVTRVTTSMNDTAFAQLINAPSGRWLSSRIVETNMAYVSSDSPRGIPVSLLADAAH